MVDPVTSGTAAGPDAWSCWAKLALIAVLGLAALTALGLLSDFLSTPWIESEIREPAQPER